MIDLQTAIKARIEKAWNSTSSADVIVNLDDDHAFTDLWVKLDNTERAYMLTFVNNLINQLIEDNHLLPVNAESFQRLTETSDDWQECRWVDYKPGDQMMLENDQATIVYKPLIRTVHENFVELNDKNVHHFQAEHTYYRIPAPAQHPDPLSDLAILVHGAYGRQFENPTAYTSDGVAYNIVGLGDSRIWPHDINEWEPAKVVPKVVETND